jgi:hypothetical protein
MGLNVYDKILRGTYLVLNVSVILVELMKGPHVQ